MKRNLCLILLTLLFTIAGLMAVDPVRTPVGPYEILVTSGEQGRFAKVDLGSGLPAYSFLGEADFQKLVYGPDGNLYLFAPGDGSISRLDPAAIGAPEIVYEASADDELKEPEDGWFDAEGSLFVVDRFTGSGVYKFSALAGGVPLPVTPVPVLGASLLGAAFEGSGITMSNTGGLILLDRSGGRLLTSPFPNFDEVRELAVGLSDPVAVAQDSRDDSYVADGTQIKRFDLEGSPLPGCYAFDSTEQPTSLHFNAGDQLFVSTSSQRGHVWRLDVSTEACTVDLSVMLKFPATGLAFGPTAVDVTKTLTEETQLFGFNSNAFELSSGLPCQATVRFSQTLPAELNGLLEGQLALETGSECGAEDSCARLAVPLGEGGFGLVHHLAGTDCPPLEEGYEFSQFLLTETLQNPRMVKCSDGCFIDDPNCECLLSELVGELLFKGYYPLNVLQPEDPILVSRGNDFSGFFVVDIDVREDAGAGEFCGFLKPLNGSITLESFDPDNPPRNLPNLNSGKTLAAKFRLADSTLGQCPKGPFIDDAEALISVARILDADGAPVFEPIDVQSTSSANEFDLLFRNENPSHQYIYNLDTTGYLSGIYSLTVVFLGNEAESETTFFRIR